MFRIDRSLLLSAHIVFIAPDTDEIARWGDWSVEWFDAHLPKEKPDFFLITSCQTALSSLAQPLTVGKSPALIVIDHALAPDLVPQLVSRVRDALPESWMIEIVDSTTVVPHSAETIALQRPIPKEEWEDLLQQTLIRSRTPQWSRATLHEIGF